MASRQRRDVVAIVEDDAGVRAALQGLLHSHGLKTRCFASAERFLRATAVAPACLILDLRLVAGMSGLELLRALRAQGRSLPTICISAEIEGNRRSQAQLLRAGALAVLAKPFDPDQLMQLVDCALGRT